MWILRFDFRPRFLHFKRNAIDLFIRLLQSGILVRSDALVVIHFQFVQPEIALFFIALVQPGNTDFTAFNLSKFENIFVIRILNIMLLSYSDPHAIRTLYVNGIIFRAVTPFRVYIGQLHHIQRLGTLQIDFIPTQSTACKVVDNRTVLPRACISVRQA